MVHCGVQSGLESADGNFEYGGGLVVGEAAVEAEKEDESDAVVEVVDGSADSLSFVEL